MPMPVRTLPVQQNWDCRGCSDCCREYFVSVTDDERKAIESQGWRDRPDFTGVDLFARMGRGWRLNQRPDGACVFLGGDNRCRIHAAHGPAGKPLACRVYPFTLVPAGDHWRVGLRYSCPSAAADHGRPLSTHDKALREYAAGVEAVDGITRDTQPPPPSPRKAALPWPDLIRFGDALGRIMADSDDAVERKLRRCLALVDVCRTAKFDEVTGGRLSEFLHVMSQAARDEVPAVDDVPPPGWVGRMLFRSMLAVYVRQDSGHAVGISRRGPWTRLAAAWRFARGRGKVPRLHGEIGDVTFAEVDQPTGPLPPATEELLTRYYRLKLQSMQFCGATNFRLDVFDGLASLAMTYPAVVWLSRAVGGDRAGAAVTALRAVDDNFGTNRLLGAGRQKMALRILAGRGEVARLIARHSR